TSVHTGITAGSVNLSWAASSSSYVTGYQVQRATAVGGPYTTIASITPGVSGITEYTVPTGASQPRGITAGPDGNVWFTEYNGNKIGKITTSGTITEYTVPSATSNPHSITAGPDGNLWFTEYNTNKVAKVTTSGAFTEYTIPTATSGPKGIDTGP